MAVLSGTAGTEDNTSQWFKVERAGAQRAGKGLNEGKVFFLTCICNIKCFVPFKWWCITSPHRKYGTSMHVK